MLIRRVEFEADGKRHVVNVTHTRTDREAIDRATHGHRAVSDLRCWLVVTDGDATELSPEAERDWLARRDYRGPRFTDPKAPWVPDDGPRDWHFP